MSKGLNVQGLWFKVGASNVGFKGLRVQSSRFAGWRFQGFERFARSP